MVGHRRSVGGPGPIRPTHSTRYGGIEVRKNIDGWRRKDWNLKKETGKVQKERMGMESTEGQK